MTNLRNKLLLPALLTALAAPAAAQLTGSGCNTQGGDAPQIAAQLNGRELSLQISDMPTQAGSRALFLLLDLAPLARPINLSSLGLTGCRVRVWNPATNGIALGASDGNGDARMSMRIPRAFRAFDVFLQAYEVSLMGNGSVGLAMTPMLQQPLG